MTSTDPGLQPAPPDTTTHPTSHPQPPLSLPIPPPPPRPRSKSSSSLPIRRFTHCVFTRPQHPNTRWYLTFLHEGTYSEVYIGHPYPTPPAGSAATPVAIKVGKEGGAGGAREDEIRTMLYDEGRIMQQLQSTHSVCRLHHQPRPSDDQLDYTDADEQRRGSQPPFIAMTLLLCDVSQLRKEGKLTRLAMWEAFVLMLRAMRGVHEGRVLHRDVKPSNFGLALTAWSSSLSGGASPPASAAVDSNSSPLSVYIIDFGQSTHAFTSSSSASALTPHCPTSFKGKSLFASIARHEARPQGRSDDLIMLLYIALDFLLPPPGLPWKAVHDKRSNLGADRGRDEILKLKREWREKWKQGERLGDSSSAADSDGSGSSGARASEDVLVGLLERLEGVGCEDEPPYDEIERELQRGWDEEAKAVGDVGKALSECVAEYMEVNDELRRKLNDRPPTAEEREREREERERRRKERRAERGGDGRSVDLTIDTKKYATQPLLPPTASPPTSATQPHSAWAVHSPYDSSPGTGRMRAWPLQSLCESTGSVKAVLDFYCIAESPRVVKAVNALLLTCTVAELQSTAMQQRTVLWLAAHPTVTILMPPPRQSPLLSLFPIACTFEAFVLLCIDACLRLRGKWADNGNGAVAVNKVLEGVLMEWTALEGEKLQLRVEQLMKEREATDLTTLLPPPTTTLGGRSAKATLTPASGPSTSKPAMSAVPAAPAGQAAAKSLVDSWATQLPSKPIQPPMRVPIRRPISTLPARPPSATPPKPLPPALPAAPSGPAAPAGFSALPEPSTMIALGKTGAGRRVPRKVSATDETVPPSTPLVTPVESTDKPPAPASTTAISDELTTAAQKLSIDLPASSSSSAAPKTLPTLPTVKKLTPLHTTARKSVQEAKLLAKERALVTDDMLIMKALQPAEDEKPEAKLDVEKKKKTSKVSGKRTEAAQENGHDGAVEVKHAEVAKQGRGARKQRVKAEEGVKEASHEVAMTLTDFMSDAAQTKTAGKPQEQGKKVKKVKQEEKDEVDENDESDDTSEDDDDDDADSGQELNDDGVYEVQTEVDYPEPPDDDVQRVFVDRKHKAEKLIAGAYVAKYYKRAPYRLREKVQAKFHDGRWYDAVVVSIDRTHDMMTASRKDAEEREALEEEAQGEYPIAGLPLHFKDYKGKEANQLQPDQLWCYYIMWMAGGEMMWYVESCLKRKHTPHTTMKGRGKETAAVTKQVGGKRGRRSGLADGAAEDDGEDQAVSKRQALNPIEQMLAEVPAEEHKEPARTSVQKRGADASVSKQSEEAVKREVKGEEMKETAQPKSDRVDVSKQAAASLAGRAVGTQAPTKNKQESAATSSPNKKTEPPPNEVSRKDEGRDRLRPITTVTEAANATLVDNRATTSETNQAVEEKADKPSTPPTPTHSSAIGDMSVTTDDIAMAVDASNKSPTTPVRHIPKKAGRLGGRAAISPTAQLSPSNGKTETTSPATSAGVGATTQESADERVGAAHQETVVTAARKAEASTADTAEIKPTEVGTEEKRTPAVDATTVTTADVKSEEAEAQVVAGSPDTSTRPATASNMAPLSSLVSSSSPELRVLLPPRPQAKTARQRSRLSEGEKLQLESAKQALPSSSPQSAGDSPSLDWTHAGRGMRVKGKPTPTGSPVAIETAEAAQQQPSTGRKRGRGSEGDLSGVSVMAKTEEGKDDDTVEVDIVSTVKRLKKGRRASTSS